MTRTADTYIERVGNSKNYLKYETEFDIEEFKANRIITVRSLYGFAEEYLSIEADELEEEILDRMEDSDRCEADEMIYFFYETAKYPSLVLFQLDTWLS